MDRTVSRFRVEIAAAPDADAEELTQLSEGLRDELLELDVETVDRVGGGPAPANAKGPAGDAVGALIVTLSNSAAAVALAGSLRAWVGRGRGRKVTIRVGADMIEVTDASADDQAKLIASWLDNHARQ